MARPGSRIPAVTLYADKEEVQTAFQIATKTHVCYNCGKEFSLLESMVALDCYQHPGFLQANGRWSCCGKKIYKPRWSDQRPILRMFDNKACPVVCPKVRGCQRCDHKTTDQPYTNKDAQPIAELSALLPFLNKEFPFALRKGFDEGMLRRCSTRKIVVPAEAATVQYQDNDGNMQVYDVSSGEPIPEGIEHIAEKANGYKIKIWQ